VMMKLAKNNEQQVELVLLVSLYSDCCLLCHEIDAVMFSFKMLMIGGGGSDIFEMGLYLLQLRTGCYPVVVVLRWERHRRVIGTTR
jgi:hypothetical protein